VEGKAGKPESGKAGKRVCGGARKGRVRKRGKLAGMGRNGALCPYLCRKEMKGEGVFNYGFFAL